MSRWCPVSYDSIRNSRIIYWGCCSPAADPPYLFCIQYFASGIIYILNLVVIRLNHLTSWMKSSLSILYSGISSVILGSGIRQKDLTIFDSLPFTFTGLFRMKLRRWPIFCSRFYWKLYPSCSPTRITKK